VGLYPWLPVSEGSTFAHALSLTHFRSRIIEIRFYEIVIYTTTEEDKAFVHANCMFGHDAQRSGRCNSSEQKRPYSRVPYLILFDTRHNSLENESEHFI
jgi:hypothetical protein